MVARISNAGKITVEAGQTSVVGDADTEFQTAVCKDGDIIFILATAGVQINVLGADPTTDQALTLRWGYEGVDESGLSYVIVRLNALEQIAEAYARLRIMADAVTANVALLGISFDAIAVNVAGLSVYDDQAEDYAVLVLDVGTSRAAIYIMGSGGSGDWSDPVYVTGPTGPQGDPGLATNYTGTGAPSSGLGSDGETYIDASNGDIYLKSSGTWSQTTNIRGDDAVSRFVFSDSTTMGNPATGKVRLNNATLSSVTVAALSAQTDDDGNPDISGWVAGWNTVSSTRKGTLMLRNRIAPQNFVIFDVNAVSDNSTWLRLTLTYVTHGGSFSANDELLMSFTPAADVTYIANIDGGNSSSVYGGVTAIDEGDSTAVYNL